ncbi:MAG: hypothetical protein AAB858_01690, partial [Patescibacteria group bacterium]
MRWEVRNENVSLNRKVNIDDYTRWKHGISRNEFESHLGLEIFYKNKFTIFLTNIYTKFRPKYHVTYGYKSKDIIELKRAISNIGKNIERAAE